MECGDDEGADETGKRQKDRTGGKGTRREERDGNSAAREGAEGIDDWLGVEVG